MVGQYCANKTKPKTMEIGHPEISSVRENYYDKEVSNHHIFNEEI